MGNTQLPSNERLPLIDPPQSHLAEEDGPDTIVDRSGKGSHRHFVHPQVAKPITISGALGDDAKHYQVRAVKRAVEESQS
jgi:hypothetical protein